MFYSSHILRRPHSFVAFLENLNLKQKNEKYLGKIMMLLHKGFASIALCQLPQQTLDKHQRSLDRVTRQIPPAQCTLCPSGTLLFSGLPMIIWQKILLESFCVHQLCKVKKSWNQSVRKVTKMNNDLTDFSWAGFFEFKKIFPKSSNQSGGQTHGWILFNLFFYFFSFPFFLKN